MKSKRTNAKPRPQRERNGGVLNDLERFLIFVSGAIIGALAGRATAPRPEVEIKIAPAAPIEKPELKPSAIPQTLASSEVRSHETSDANVPALGMLLVVLVVFAFVMHAALWWWVNTPGPGSIDAATQWQVTAARVPEPQKNFPQLQLSPQRELKEFLANQEQRLRVGAAPDETNARISIERAMEAVAQDGVPKWKANAKPISPIELQQQRANEGAQKQ